MIDLFVINMCVSTTIAGMDLDEASAELPMDIKIVEQTIQRTLQPAREQIELSIDRWKSDQ